MINEIWTFSIFMYVFLQIQLFFSILQLYREQILDIGEE